MLLEPITSLMQLSTQYPPEFSVKVVLPALPRSMVNPIGAGDAVSSGTLMRWCRNVPCIEDQESSYQVHHRHTVTFCSSLDMDYLHNWPCHSFPLSRCRQLIIRTITAPNRACAIVMVDIATASCIVIRSYITLCRCLPLSMDEDPPHSNVTTLSYLHLHVCLYL